MYLRSLFLVMLLFCVCGRAGGAEAYLADFDRSRIYRYDTLSGELVTLLSTAFPYDIEVNRPSGRMFWAGTQPARVMSATLQGADVRVLHNVNAGGFGPTDVAIDPLRNRIYWPDNGTDRILSSALDGSDLRTVIAGTGGAGTLAVHSSLGKLYWFDGALNVQRANLDGSDVETIVPNAGVMSLAFDEVAGKMYMARGLNGILRANVDGTNIETVIPDMFNRNFQGLALDLIEQKMYFSDVLGSERLQRANLDGSNIETLIAGTRIDPSALFGIAVDPIPEPSALLLCAFALVFACLICRF